MIWNNDLTILFWNITSQRSTPWTSGEQQGEWITNISIFTIVICLKKPKQMDRLVNIEKLGERIVRHGNTRHHKPVINPTWLRA